MEHWQFADSLLDVYTILFLSFRLPLGILLAMSRRRSIRVSLKMGGRSESG